MNTLRAFIHAESLRWRATPINLLLLLIGGAVIVSIIVLTAVAVNVVGLREPARLQALLLVGGTTAYPLAFVYGVLGMAGEFHHHTITTSVLAAPRRWPLIAAKVVFYAALGVALGLIASLVALAATAVVLSSRGVDFEWQAILTSPYVYGSAIAAGLFGAIGAGMAAMLGNQSLTLILGVGWMMLVDFTALITIGDAARFFPGGAALALLTGNTGPTGMPAGQAAGILAAFAAVPALIGVGLLRRRSLT